MICSSCYDCKWHGGSGQYSLGGGGHTMQECLEWCKNKSDCTYATISETGYCHLFDNCDKKDKSASWIRFKKMGKYCRYILRYLSLIHKNVSKNAVLIFIKIFC